MPEEKLGLTRESSEGDQRTYLRAEVEHFCMFGLGWEVNENDRYMKKDQWYTRSVVVHNSSGMTLLVVMMPTRARQSGNGDGTHKFSFEVHSGFGGVTFGRDRTTETKTVLLPASYIPDFRTIIDQGKSHIDLETKGDYVRLIICTVEELPEPESTLRACPAGSTDTASTSSGETPPADDKGRNTSFRKVLLKCWDSFNTYGGRYISVRPAFSRGQNVTSAVVNMDSGSNLARCALALEGHFATPVSPTRAPAPAPASPNSAPVAASTNTNESRQGIRRIFGKLHRG